MVSNNKAQSAYIITIVILGRFQMQVLANCGHMVHEDVPDKVRKCSAILRGVFQFNHVIPFRDTIPEYKFAEIRLIV